jgi:hypothetical protein
MEMNRIVVNERKDSVPSCCFMGHLCDVCTQNPTARRSKHGVDLPAKVGTLRPVERRLRKTTPTRNRVTKHGHQTGRHVASCWTTCVFFWGGDAVLWGAVDAEELCLPSLLVTGTLPDKADKPARQNEHCCCLGLQRQFAICQAF